MEVYKYRVIIQSSNGVLTGVLQNTVPEWNKTDFEPLTVLGDLLKVVTYSEESPYPADNYSFQQSYIEHPFFFEKVFDCNTQFSKPLRGKHFFVALNELKEIIINNRKLSANEIEILKQFLSLTFVYKMEFKELNPLYKLGYREFKGKKVYEYQYSPLDYDCNFDLNAVIEKKGSDFRFIYSCRTIEDIMFSVLHYLTLFNYQFTQCNHCKKYFATQTLKQKYCTRKSPYKGQEKNQCEQAVKTVFQDFGRRKKRIYTRLSLYAKGEDEKKINTFLGEYHALRAVARESPTVENLEKLEQYLFQNGGRKRKYRQKTPSE